MPKESIGERLAVFLAHKNTTVPRLSEELGYVRSEKLQRLVRDRSAQPSYDTIMDITNHYPDLNLEWWLKGTGSMLQKIEEHYNDDAGLIAVMRSNLPEKEKNLLLVELVRKANSEVKRLTEELQAMAGLIRNNNRMV